MFDDFDPEKAAAEEAKREEIKKMYGDDEAELQLMREQFASKSIEQNVKSLAKSEADIEEITDEGSIVKDLVGQVVNEEIIEEVIEEVINETSGDENEIVNETGDVESEPEVPVKQVNDTWLKEKEELLNRLKQEEEARKVQEGILIKMFQEQQAAKQKPAEPENVVEPEVELDPEVAKLLDEATKKMTYAEDENAASLLKQAMLIMAKKAQPKVVKEEVTEEKIAAILAKRDQELYNQQFEKARDDFFNTDEGKKIWNDEDLRDLFTVKFERVRNSGEHRNPEDLFKKTAEKVLPTKASSSTANKPVIKVADSLKEDASKSGEAKKQAVKPTGASNAGKPDDGKKFSQVDAYTQLMRSMGQDF